jgi:D-3-phosphoglycerate dehydrogenase/(S)-sulfolactate dehydrogenase
MAVVLITPEAMREKPAPYVDIVREAGFEVRYPKNPIFTRGHCSEAETIDELSVASAVIAGGEVFSANVVAALPKLRVIARSGVGYDKVNVPACTKHDKVVTITPTANHEAVAEQAFALIFAFAKSIVPNDKGLRAGRWPGGFLTKPVRGQTLGILGLGRIGRSTALRGLGVGMKVIAHETRPDMAFVQKHGIELVDFDTILARSDYLSVHCPLNDETRGLMNRKTFAKMKPGSVFINTSRGGLQVEADEIEALRSGHLSGAGLDVFEQEPTSPDNPLFAFENVVMSPHIAGTDTKSMEDMGIEAARCIVALYRGDWPDEAALNPELKGRWKW